MERTSCYECPDRTIEPNCHTDACAYWKKHTEEQKKNREKKYKLGQLRSDIIELEKARNKRIDRRRNDLRKRCK